MSFSSFKPFIFTILFLGCFSLAFAQSQKEIDETYRDANSYFYFEDYEEALALYLMPYPITVTSTTELVFAT
jgi:hypothetical protein